MTERSDIEAAKHAARVRAREARSALDDATCELAAEAIAARVLALPQIAKARTVLAYGATAEEVETAPLVAALRARGTRIAYPRVESPGVLGVHEVVEGDALEHGMFGILEPRADAPRIALDEIDAAIVPGVAFDESARRLGYGGGYYDRLLPLLREDCARIGIAYDEQLLAEIPAAEHDVDLDAVVTPTRVVRRA